MIPALANHLLQSTVFAAVAGTLTLFLRTNHARTRYWLWLTASLKFLIPFSFLVEMGHRLSWSSAPVIAQSRTYLTPQLSRVIDAVGAPFATQYFPVSAPAATSGAIAPPGIAELAPTLLLTAWICGCAAVLFIWSTRWCRVAVSVRAARVLRAGAEVDSLRRLERIARTATRIELRSSVSRMEPGVFGIFRPVLLLPQGLADHLEFAQLDAIFAHELCHVRRRDNLTAAIHMLVEAIFWFHPLVWWIGAKLVEERERACDEEVVRLGSDPEVYAETILKICKVYLVSPLACAAGISGADLRKRIESIMDNPFLKNLSLGKKILLGAMGFLVLVTPILIGILSAPAPGRAQSTQSKVPVAVSTPVAKGVGNTSPPELLAQAVPRPTGNPPNEASQAGLADSPAFTAADVHVSMDPPDQNPRGGFYAGGRYEIRSVTLVELIMTAYDVARRRVVGGPNWLGTDRFDVIAKAPADATPETQQLMLQALLADRFRLVVHRDTRPLPAFALTVRTGGPQMKPASGSGDSGCQQQRGPAAEGVTYSCRNMTMAAFAETLPDMGGYYLWDTSVVDKSGLNGAWDFSLKFTPQTALAAAGSDAVKIFDAVDKQLGLKLELTKIALPVIAVDSANEKPTANPPGVTEKMPAPPTAFEVADIKPSDPNSAQTNTSFGAGGRLNMRNATLKDLIAMAWNVNSDRVVGPRFVDTDHFDIIAKPPSDGTASVSVQSIDMDSMRLMMRALLADRFRLAVHNEDQPVSTYVLTAVKPKLTKADPSNRSECQNVPATTPGLRTRLITCQNTTMAKLPEVLLRFAPGYFRGVPIVDATGIDGPFDITLNFSPANAVQGISADRPLGDAPVASDPNGAISIFEAFEQQLGLKLALQKRPMPVLVIDHVEQKPTDN